MKDKFEEAIGKLIESYIDLPYNQNTLIEEINTLHQQALKEEKEKLINKIQTAKKYYEGIGKYDYSAGFEKAIYLIAKENNITL